MCFVLTLVDALADKAYGEQGYEYFSLSSQTRGPYPVSLPRLHASHVLVEAMKSFLIQEHALLMFLILPFAQVFGNVEKTIFLGPETKNNWPRDYPSSSDFHLDELSPSHPSIRRQLKASFSSAEHSSKGTETWLLLKRLEPGQRYEVRICWSATVGLYCYMRISNPLTGELP